MEDSSRAKRQFRGLKEIAGLAGWWILAISVSGLIAAHSLAAYLAAEKPEWALAIQRSNAAALLRTAEANTATIVPPSRPTALDAGRIAAARSLIAKALYSDPLNARAFEMLGSLASIKGDNDEADAFMRAALSRSRRSPAALTWMAADASEKNEPIASANYIDLLLRVRPEVAPLVVPTLVRIASSPDGLRALISNLARAPRWRTSLFRSLNNDPQHGDLALKLLFGLRATPNPPSNHEVDDYVRSLAVAHNFQLAYYAWLQLLPAEKAKVAGFLFDGDFRFAPTANPFDWTVHLGNGVLAEVTPNDDEASTRSLSLVLTGGHVGFPPAEQLIVLPQGRYTFSGRIQGNLSGPRGLKWKVTCIAPSRKIAGETTVLGGAFPNPTQFSASLDIPDQCSAQSLILLVDARSATETIASGSVSFSNLRIVRERL